MLQKRSRHFVSALILTALAITIAPAGAAASSGSAPARLVGASQHNSREVFGFALASSLTDPGIGHPSWNFDLLSTVAVFGVHVGSSGSLAGDAGWTTWNSSALTNLVSLAHQHGTKVVLTVILQDFSPNNPNMCAGLQHADATVAQTVQEVKAKGVDGVNIDYEGLDGSCGTGDPYWSQHAMTAFAQKMRAGLGSSYYLSVDTYAAAASDGYGFFDVRGIAAYADSLFVMAYDLEYSIYRRPPTSCSTFCLGPTSPLTGYYYSDAAVISQYVAVAGAGKVIFGVPYYGRKACVGAAVPNALPTSSVVADSYLDASGEASDPAVQPGSYTMHRDASSSGAERWDTWYNTTLQCTRELYWDDTVSLGKKYDLVNSSGLRGVGIWNLNYGGSAPELWYALAAHFTGCSGVNIAFAPASPSNVGTAITVTGAASGCANPLYKFFLRTAASGTWQLVQDYSTNSAYRWNSAGAPAGPVYFGVWVRDANSTASVDANTSAAYVLFAPCANVSVSFTPSGSAGAGAPRPVTSGAVGWGLPLFRVLVGAVGPGARPLLPGFLSRQADPLHSERDEHRIMGV